MTEASTVPAHVALTRSFADMGRDRGHAASRSPTPVRQLRCGGDGEIGSGHAEPLVHVPKRPRCTSVSSHPDVLCNVPSANACSFGEPAMVEPAITAAHSPAGWTPHHARP